MVYMPKICRSLCAEILIINLAPMMAPKMLVEAIVAASVQLISPRRAYTIVPVTAMGTTIASDEPWALCWLTSKTVVSTGTRMVPPPIPRIPASVPAIAPAKRYQMIFTIVCRGGDSTAPESG